MRISRVLIVSVTALATVAGMSSSASAAPATTATHIVAPYATTYTGDSTDCRTGAVCTPRYTASATSGEISATMDMQRAVADEPAAETGHGYADQVVFVRVPKGATQLTATFSWMVRSAATTARADHGEAHAYATLFAFGDCSGCKASSAVEILATSSSTVPDTDNADGIADVQKTLTFTMDNLAGKGTVRLYTGGTAQTDMNASRVCIGLPGCDLLPPIDANHSGTAHAAIDATLTSMDISYA